MIDHPPFHAAEHRDQIHLSLTRDGGKLAVISEIPRTSADVQIVINQGKAFLAGLEALASRLLAEENATETPWESIGGEG